MKTTLTKNKAIYLLLITMIICLPFSVLGQLSSSLSGDDNNVQQPGNNDPIWGSQQASVATTSSSTNGIAPPPDDPVDVPIDGGVGILLVIGIFIGYKNSKKKKVNLDLCAILVLGKFNSCKLVDESYDAEHLYGEETSHSVNKKEYPHWQQGLMQQYSSKTNI